MKNRNFLLSFIICLILINSCGSPKVVKCNKQPFIKIDSSNAQKRVVNFSVETPEKFKKEDVSGGLFYYLEIDSLTLKGFHNKFVTVFIRNNKIRKECNSSKYYIDDFLKSILYYKKKFLGKKFKYVLLKSKHKRYNEIYILKYKENIQGRIYTISSFLFFNKNIGYSIDYKAREKYFDVYLPEVEKMVSSFTIEN